MKYLVLFAIVGIVYVYGDENATTPKTSTKWRKRELAGTAADRDKLLDDLFLNYKPENYPENSTVEFGLSVINVDFCEDHSVMSMNVWLRIGWHDNRLIWDEKERGISVLSIPPRKLWLPDILLYNGVKPSMECFDSNVLIYSTGEVLWVPPCSLKSYCNLTLTQHPYDEQECILRFGSWTFDGFTMGLEIKENCGDNKTADVSDYMGQKYRVTKNVAEKQEKFYECCEEPYLNIKYTLGFTRRTEGETSCAKI